MMSSGVAPFTIARNASGGVASVFEMGDCVIKQMDHIRAPKDRLATSHPRALPAMSSRT